MCYSRLYPKFLPLSQLLKKKPISLVRHSHFLGLQSNQCLPSYLSCLYHKQQTFTELNVFNQKSSILLPKKDHMRSIHQENKTESPNCDVVKPASPVELSKKEKLKQAIKDYGATVVVFHIGISLISLGGFYLAASSGLNMQDMVKSVGFDSAVTAATVGNAGTFVIAYAIHKVFAPVRISITLISAPFIVRYLRQKGILKVKNNK